nr:immunoglobulin heavy chain junction region [Macaca mulatta]MOV44025.1 immunoglobulin heavy chain junction region [Macaca mulatta]MOV44611.1 immunoglobulin heavy chain junction region [Macaca mulatta]MOV47010.1 immunoglobulin heavy chain junction region [Macaca mulatta]
CARRGPRHFSSSPNFFDFW